MSWELSEEHEMLRKMVRDFAESEIAPHAAQWDIDHHFPVDVVRKMGELGLFGIVFPEEFGGPGGDGGTLPFLFITLRAISSALALAFFSQMRAHANSMPRMARPAGITTKAGPGSTIMATPTSSTDPPTMQMTTRFATLYGT
jgi:alkylation response protein AidB-like acyl-CoA dehydrogenase